jgi:hypothetical protein
VSTTSAIPYEIPPTIDDGWTISSPDQASGSPPPRSDDRLVHASPALNVHAV